MARLSLTAGCPVGAVMDRGSELRAPTRIRTPSRTGTAIGSTTAVRLVRGRRSGSRFEPVGASAERPLLARAIGTPMVMRMVMRMVMVR